MSQNSYDDIPYAVVSFSETHPRRLQAVARVFGLDSPPPAACRVLELGCAVGGNIVPMAYSLPGATFVGIDLSAGQVAQARALADAVGVRNVDLRAASITDISPDWGKFDYIICHGVFSWVPPAVREKILDICGENLSERGVAYVSFNVLPGWHTRLWIREAMLFHTEGIADPSERARAGRDFINALAESPFAPPDKLAVLRGEANYLRDKDASYILHDYFEADNEPVYFRDFAAGAARRGLQYLGDAKLNAAAGEGWEPAQAWMDSCGDDLVRVEQYADFINTRMFRRTLLCRADAALDRAGAASRIGDLYAETYLRQFAHGAGATRFEHPAGARYITQSPAMRSALAAISAGFPRAVRVSDVIDPAPRDEVARGLLQCWATGVIRLYVDPPVFSHAAGAAPRASAVARHLAGRGSTAINLRHETITLSAEQRRIVPLLDGSHERNRLAAEAGIGRDLLEQALAQLGFAAILEA